MQIRELMEFNTDMMLGAVEVVLGSMHGLIDVAFVTS